ncbi:VIP peptides-like isoform X3 [Lethenteron reissneri]|uniref:VIP peptides-like isoform X3 n=1 Tax=Lethenteron reissneri TaxID=7753 RepID=UPI002AB79655|nr:VIP peptides-like isoform X3 [Lethenteron reissneri]
MMTCKLPYQAVMLLSIATLRYHGACCLAAVPPYPTARSLGNDLDYEPQLGSFVGEDAPPDGVDPPESPVQDDHALYDLLYNAMKRTERHADSIYTHFYSKYYGRKAAKNILRKLIAGKRSVQDGDDGSIAEPSKRHSDGLFTDLYSRSRGGFEREARVSSLASMLTGLKPMDRALRGHLVSALAPPVSVLTRHTSPEPPPDLICTALGLPFHAQSDKQKEKKTPFSCPSASAC